ncbi:hypothetical protein QBC43DRAFT_348297 [Cladorrhinum sp. PSN259]|nr:hypothetical protein QBC43DRAFT_348297 [Cladorrhinum sp. PSN259]
MSVPLYWRQFTRDGSPDVDTRADAAFLAANFIDYFGQWLQEGSNGLARSFDALVLPYWNGSFIQAGETPDWPWFNPHIRLVTLVCQAGKSFFGSSWTLCIVGSRLLYSENRNESFLQVASWNGSEFRFYQNDLVNGTGPESVWNYFGKSMDAFGANEYLGPFNGHVNGCCIMKELHRPWLHWYSLSGSFQSCFAPDDVTTFEKAPYITTPGLGLLSSVKSSPGELETAVRSGISNWFGKRLKNDFIDTTQTPSKPLQSPTNIPRWTAHMFLTTTINIGAAVSAGQPGVYALPYDHFYDNELLQNFDLIPSDIKMNATFNQSDCIAAANNLGLSLIQELNPDKQPPTKPDFTLPWQSLGGDRRDEPDHPDVGYKIALAGEGVSPFNFLQASHEDAQGVAKSQHIFKVNDNKAQPSFIGLFSTHTFYAIMMLDFWNPIYSWKRGILMQYVPQTTNFNGKSYDLEQNFIANVKKSSKAGEPDAPESQFLQLLDKTLEDFQQMIRDYLAAVANRINNDPVPALQDYLSLAESRRRIYRPLPLDEFGYTLPFATKMPFTPGKDLLEMTQLGTIQIMDQRGQDFLNAWTTSLAEPDPHVVPSLEAKNHSSEPGAPPLSISALPRPATLAIRCQSLTSQVSSSSSSSSSLVVRRFRRAGGGCPFRNQSVAEAPCESSAKPGGTGAATA